jgi:hypothetical protein
MYGARARPKKCTGGANARRSGTVVLTYIQLIDSYKVRTDAWCHFLGSHRGSGSPSPKYDTFCLSRLPEIVIAPRPLGVQRLPGVVSFTPRPVVDGQQKKKKVCSHLIGPNEQPAPCARRKDQREHAGPPKKNGNKPKKPTKRRRATNLAGVIPRPTRSGVKKVRALR